MSRSTSFSKQALLIAIGLSPACVMASVPNSPFNGIYGGIAGGDLRTDSRISASAISRYVTNFQDEDDAVLALAQDHVHLYKDTFIGDAFIGYGHFVGCSNFYLAGEIFGDWATRYNTLNNWAFRSDTGVSLIQDISGSLSYSATVKLKNSEFGFDARPGFLVDVNTMLYGRVGVAFNRITNSTSNFFLESHNRVSGQESFSTQLDQSNHHNVAALRLGVGLEHLVGNNLAITADYIYTYYGTARTSAVTDTITSGEFLPPITNIDGLQAASSATISTQAIMLGIKYYFYNC